MILTPLRCGPPVRNGLLQFLRQSLAPITNAGTIQAQRRTANNSPIATIRKLCQAGRQNCQPESTPVPYSNYERPTTGTSTTFCPAYCHAYDFTFSLVRRVLNKTSEKNADSITTPAVVCPSFELSTCAPPVILSQTMTAR
jgi:hypothetical protein